LAAILNTVALSALPDGLLRHAGAVLIIIGWDQLYGEYVLFFFRTAGKNFSVQQHKFRASRNFSLKVNAPLTRI